MNNLTTVEHLVGDDDHLRRFGHSGGVLWFTGLSASGKSTLAMRLEQCLLKKGYACYTLDGDNVRQGLNIDLGFSPEDRIENIRRVGEVAALFAAAGLICITAFISPYRKDRSIARAAAGNRRFHEIHVAADLSVCEARDPKGLYRKARAGELHGLTGVDAPYEPPSAPELVLDTGTESVEQSLDKLVSYLISQHPKK